MRDIADLLSQLSLQQYLPLFESNNIGPDLLDELSDDDLRAIGIASLGHRKHILRAISQSRTRIAEPAPGIGNTQINHGERRQVTVMFCDLVGSTALSVQLDPEDLDQVIRQYQGALTPLILQFGGTLTRFVGDGILAYFGYPRANEYDPERAVRSALLAIEKIKTLRPLPELDRELEIRIGIATGEVVVSELQWLDDNLQEPSATGEPPNLAARLQDQAPPNGIVISARTRSLCGDVFLYEKIPDQLLRGFNRPMALWQVTGTRRVASRFEAIQIGRRFTRLCGRGDEYQSLLSSWRDASRHRRGSAVLLRGAAGIGKSRLVRILTDELDNEPYATLRFFCEPYQTNTALFPIMYQFQRLANFTPEDPVEIKRERLETYVREWSQSAEQNIGLLAQSYGLPPTERYPRSNLAPQRLKQATIEVFIEWILSHAAQLPLLVVVEDLHWIDPTTLDLLHELSSRLDDTQTLLLISARTEFQLSLPHFRKISLRRLDASSGAEMIHDLAEEADLPAPLTQKILERADGIPLYIEELTRGALEAISQRDDSDHAPSLHDAASSLVPASLQDSLMARLDRLGEIKQLVQTSAAIGREFTSDLLLRVAELPTDEVDRALHILVEDDMLAQLPGTTTSRFVFKHALIRDAAYNSLLRRQRQALHLRIAQALVEHFPQTASARPELVATHFRDAEEYVRAVQYWTQAGRQASAVSANQEAVEHLRHGEYALSQMPDSDEKRTLELSLRMAQGPALIATKGYSNQQVLSTYNRAADLLDSVAGTPTHAQVLSGLWAYNLVRGEFESATRYADQLLTLAEQLQNDDLLLETHVVMGVTLSYTGPLTDSLHHSQKASAMYQPQLHASHALLYGQDPLMASLSYAAMAYCGLGQLDTAGEHTARSIAHAREFDHKRSLAFALANGARCHFKRSDYIACETVACEGIELSAEYGYPDFQAMSRFHLAAAQYRLRREPTLIAAISDALNELIKVGNSISLPFYHAVLAEAYGEHDNFDQAFENLRLADAALARLRRDCDAPEVWRIRGEIEARQCSANSSEPEHALVSLRRAHTLAGEIETPLWRLKCATSLAHHDRSAESQCTLQREIDATTQGRELPGYRRAIEMLTSCQNA